MTQIVRKFIADNSINGTKIRLDNNEVLRALNAAGTTTVPILKVNLTDQVEFQNLPYAEANLPIPSAPKQFATIEYITNYIKGKNDAKDAVSYLADMNIAGTFSAGNSTTPASITGNVQLSIDGKLFTAADLVSPRLRIALVGQTDPIQNGVYDLTAVTSTSYTLTRSYDFDGIYDQSGIEVTTGAYFPVTSGSFYAGYEALLVTADPIVINTTPLTFVKYPSTLSLIGGDMITKTNNTFSVDLAVISGLESTNPGADNGQLRIKVDTNALEKDKTTKIDAATNALIAKKPRRLTVTLTSTDITNQYVDLPFVASQDGVFFWVAGGSQQGEGLDYTVNYTGGTGGSTRVFFANGLATGGVSALVAGDILQLSYESF